MHYPPQCWSQKKHGPHTWGEYEPDPRAPYDCPGLDEGMRFIDKFHKVWVCFSGDPGPGCSPIVMHTNLICGWRWTANLDIDDMARLARAFDMSKYDTEEFLEDSYE